jgi:hypothetical protein
MRHRLAVLLSCCFLSGAATASADDVVVIDCGQKSLADAVRDARDDRRTIVLFTGVCAGPVVIRTDGLVIIGVSPAIIDGGGGDGVTVRGAGRVTLANFEVRNGVNGILAVNGAGLTLAYIDSHDHLASGIAIQGASSVALTDVGVNGNGAYGLDLQSGSTAALTGSFAAAGNHVAGLSASGSAITASQAATVNANNNLNTGLALAAGSRMVSLGATLNTSGNSVNGVLVQSNSTLVIDAASTLDSFNNGEGVVVQEGSVMTVVNTPQFSGVQGFSTLNAHNNTASGVRILSGSTLALTNQARVLSSQNLRGLVADNGVGLTLVNSTITGNNAGDIQLTFGTRADLRTLAFGSYTCDATVLVRGTSGIICPH